MLQREVLGGKKFHWMRKSEQVVTARVPVKAFCGTKSFGLGICIFKALKVILIFSQG